MTSGVRPTFSGTSAGSPGGLAPSGSRSAARWPWLRCALTTDIAAATPASSSSSTGPVAADGAGPPPPRAAARSGAGAAREAEALAHLLVEAVLAAQQGSIRARNSPLSAPWMTRWS